MKALEHENTQLRSENQALSRRLKQVESIRARAPSPPPAEPSLCFSCAQLVTFIADIYNQPIALNVPSEARGPMLKKKVDSFKQFLHDSEFTVSDLSSGNVLLKSTVEVLQRYGCVFRESGAGLRHETFRRWFVDVVPGVSGGYSYCVDLEKHSSLVVPNPKLGRLDGALGTVGPATQHLLAVYEAGSGGRLTRMWVTRDVEHLGETPSMSRAELEATDLFKAGWAKVLQCARARCPALDGPRLDAELRQATTYVDYHTDVKTIG